MHKQDKGKLILVLGGARSGKSSFAEKIATNISDDVIYLATAAALDSEMVRRVKIHKEKRPQHWVTIEETVNLVEVLQKMQDKTDVILIDCLTIWLSNMLINAGIPSAGISWAEKESFILGEAKKLAIAASNAKTTVIVVSNEVSLGLVPDNRLGRAFRDVAGLANQVMAQYADKVYVTIAGIPLEIKGLALNNI